MRIYAAAIAAMKDKDFEFCAAVIYANTKTEARVIAKNECLRQFPKKDGYTSHRVSVTNAITEVKA